MEVPIVVGRFSKPAFAASWYDWNVTVDEEEGRFGKPAHETLRESQMWNLPGPPGFQGLDPAKAVTVYTRHLPHWRQDGATYFVTFRLNDSLPQSKLEELKVLREDWLQRHPPPHTNDQLQELSQESMRRTERWLDEGMGSCVLKDPAASRLTASAMHHFDGGRYELACYVVMPNHVHAVLRPLLGDTDPLEKILQSWKRHTSYEINLLHGIQGTLWQEESFDRIIRDEEHLYRVIQYVGGNPARAGLDRMICPTWIRPSWVKLGWGFQEA